MANRPFLMYPAIGQDISGVNSRALSSCSYKEIMDVIAVKGKCLKKDGVDDGDDLGNDDGDADAAQCTYIGSQSTACSEPCGGGTRLTLAESCSCPNPNYSSSSSSSDGGHNHAYDQTMGANARNNPTSNTVCDIATGPIEIATCNNDSCGAATVDGSSNVSAVVSIAPDRFAAGPFEALVSAAIGWLVEDQTSS